jgi:hypothetical protein
MTTKTLDTKTRLAAAIEGAFVADAASMGLHWIYDPKELLQSVKDRSAPEFQNPPTPRYYSSKEFPGHYMAGMLSPYGEQLWFATDYCATRSSVDGQEMSAGFREWAESFGGRPDGATKEFLANVKSGKSWNECGANDNQGKFTLSGIGLVRWYIQISQPCPLTLLRSSLLYEGRTRSLFVRWKVGTLDQSGRGCPSSSKQ